MHKELKLQIIDLVKENEDKIILQNVLSLLERSKVGMEKYNVTLEKNNLSSLEWLEHLRQELLDAANYTQTLKERL
jgi:uncharacterized protein YdiU (UPF0061 family)